MMLIHTLTPAEEAGWKLAPDMAKALVMAAVARIVEAGNAAIVVLESGTIELRLVTDEIFHLGERTVTRIA